MALQNIRSNTASKRPLASGLSDGQIAVNTNETSPGLFFKGASGAVLKVGPVHVGTSAPNSSPATGGSTGNAIGEQWLDTSNSGYVFKIWDGTAWRSETGEFVDVAGDTMTGNLTISGADLIMSNGEIVAETGSAATPSITFTGDLDTGFYKPAANELAISTGGTGRVFIDDSGNVGIGTSNPATVLHVAATAPRIRIEDSDATGTPYSEIRGDSGNLFYNANQNAALGGDHIWSSGGASNELMRIDSSGKVGIGTSTPANLLQIQGNATFEQSAGGQFAIRGSTNSQNRFNLGFDTINNYAWLQSITVGTAYRPIALNPSGGNVGIGTSTPDALLKLQAGDSDNPANSFAIRQNNGADTSQTTFSIEVSPTDGVSRLISSATSAAKLAFYTQGNEAMRIDSSGKVGIGTSSPGALFEVGPANSSIQLTGADLKFTRSTAYFQHLGTGSFIFRDKDNSNNYITFDYNGGNNRLAFGSKDYTIFNTGSSFTEAMRIDSNGNVGIGTSSPDRPLHIKSTGLTRIKLETSSNSSNADIACYNSNGLQGVFGYSSVNDSIDLDSRSATGAITFSRSGSERMRITSSGNVGIGTNSPGDKLDVVGNVTGRVTDSSTGAQLNNIGSLEIWRSAANPFIDFKSSASEDYDCRIQQATNGLAFSTGGNGTSFERMRIDSNGRLLIGTSSSLQTSSGETPFAQVAGTDSRAGLSTIRYSNDNNSGGIYIGKSRGATVGANGIVANGDELGRITFSGNDGTDTNTIAARIQAYVDGTPGANDMPGRLVFSTTADGASNPTERMRISSSGSVYIGKTTDSVTEGGLTLGSSGFTRIVRDNSFALVLQRLNSDGGVAVFNRDNATVGSISITTTATAYNTSSDYRLKENVTPVSDGITRLQQLKPSRFNFIADPDTVVDGFLAHEVQTIVPEAITGEKDAVDDEGNPEYQGIDQSKMVPLVVAALQEALVKIESLEQRLTDAGL